MPKYEFKFQKPAIVLGLINRNELINRSNECQMIGISGTDCV